MERIAQYLDDLEDLLFACACGAERLRRMAAAATRLSVTVGLLAFGVILAFREPPLALAAVSLSTVTLLYRATVSHPRRSPATS